MRRDRLIALRTAALVALGFVVLRVVYRVIFGGGSGTGSVLLDPPRVPLGGPFTGIFLFGTITTGGIATAALSALPFAALVLLVGLIGVVVDLRALLVRGSQRGPLRTVSRTLVIALSTFPALRASVARVHIARQLRAERSMASFLVPVLGQTIERAIALGASMEVRGFAATRHPDVDRSRPVVIADAALGYDEAWILDPVDLRLAPGTLTLVTGATGSGKSTLLDAMSGLFQHLSEGRQEGAILIGGIDRQTTPPRETAGFVGVVPQAVKLSFVAATVSEELGFALTTQGRPGDDVSRRVAAVAEELGITSLLGRQITELSAGEACMVAIGGAVASEPGLLILDEPLADLDTAARDRVVGVVTRLAHEHRVCVIVSEHTPQHWGASPDRTILLRPADPETPAASAPRRAAPAPTPVLASERSATSERRGTSSPVLRARGLTARHGTTIALDGVDLDLFAGDITAVTGPNGAGKSTLLLELARPRARNTVLVEGADVARLSFTARRRSVALVPEAFDDLLFATSVAAECARADRRSASRGTAALFLSLLGIDGRSDPSSASELVARHPRDLSAGQRLCLVIAIQLSARPHVLLVDEPTRGLDSAARGLVGAALLRIAADGTAVVVATHDADFAAEYASRGIRMDSGRLLAPTSAVAR